MRFRLQILMNGRSFSLLGVQPHQAEVRESF